MTDGKVTLCTAVGTYHRFPTLMGMTPPFVCRRFRIPKGVTISEFIIWELLTFRYYSVMQLIQIYTQKANEAGIHSKRTITEILQSLVDRGMVIKGEGDTEVEALMDILRQARIYRYIDKPSIVNYPPLKLTF